MGFFKLHNENIIGYKQLTNADLGRSPTSHQTHIGLFGDVFTFLPNSISIEDAMVIFNGNVVQLHADFNRIENPDHTYRSPKIKTGGRDTVSVVSFIRDHAKEYPNESWFLFWFALESEQPVFFFFRKESDEYKKILSFGIDLSDNIKNKLTKDNKQFSLLLSYLEEIVNISGQSIIKTLEVDVQTNGPSLLRYRPYDIMKARDLFCKIGKKGEALIDQYFAEKLLKKHIANYKWNNKNSESGLPYDFYIEQLDGEIIYLDVKTTGYNFEQGMIFSSQEIKFVMEECRSKYQYHIFRVYCDDNKNNYLRICNDPKKLFQKIYDQIIMFENDLKEIAVVRTINMAVSPSCPILSFGHDIYLGTL